MRIDEEWQWTAVVGKKVMTGVGTILNPRELSPSFSSAALIVWEREHSYKTHQTQTITPSSPEVLLTKIFSNELAVIFFSLIFLFALFREFLILMPKCIKDKALCHAGIFIRILSGYHVSSYSSGLQDKYLLFSMDGNSLCANKTQFVLNSTHRPWRML